MGGFGFVACNSDDAVTEIDETVDTTGNNQMVIPEQFTNNAPDLTIYMEQGADGKQYVVIESENIPDHNSPYFSQNDSRYEAYNGDNQNFHRNPNSISEQTIVYRIPASPTPAANPEATPLGPIGVAVNGIAIQNQYAGPNDQPLTSEIDSFDQYNGHPTDVGAYHYHVEPLSITNSVGKDGLVGWLLDGYPVYGPMENGQEVSNQDLDEYHGHSHATAEYPNGIYHYHITDADPYINGNGYFGVAGTVTF